MGLYDWVTVESEAQKKKNLEEAKERLKMSRPVNRYNKEGGESSVRMAYASTPDGGGVAFPMIYPQEGKRFSTNPADWDEYSFGVADRHGRGGKYGKGVKHKGNWTDALKRAYAEGEVYEFKTEAEAKDFAAGSWKEGHYFSSPTDEYLPDPSYKPSIASLGEKIPDNLWKDLMEIKKDLSLDAHIKLYNNLAKEYKERGQNIDLMQGYVEPYTNKDGENKLWGKPYSPIDQKRRYDPEAVNSQVGYVMNQKDINEKYIGRKTGQAAGFYQESFRWDEPDTVVMSPEWIYNILGKDDKVDASTLLGIITHEDMHAPGVNKSGRTTRGSIGHKDSKQHVLDNTRMMETTQEAYSKIINDLFEEKQSMIGKTPEGEKGVSNFSFYEETAKALQKWLESKNLDTDYRKEPFEPSDVSLFDNLVGGDRVDTSNWRWQSYDRLKTDNAK